MGRWEAENGTVEEGKGTDVRSITASTAPALRSWESECRHRCDRSSGEEDGVLHSGDFRSLFTSLENVYRWPKRV